jgi:hypothetical protein
LRLVVAGNCGIGNYIARASPNKRFSDKNASKAGKYRPPGSISLLLRYIYA